MQVIVFLNISTHISALQRQPFILNTWRMSTGRRAAARRVAPARPGMVDDNAPPRFGGVCKSKELSLNSGKFCATETLLLQDASN